VARRRDDGHTVCGVEIRKSGVVIAVDELDGGRLCKSCER